MKIKKIITDLQKYIEKDTMQELVCFIKDRFKIDEIEEAEKFTKDYEFEIIEKDFFIIKKNDNKKVIFLLKKIDGGFDVYECECNNYKNYTYI